MNRDSRTILVTSQSPLETLEQELNLHEFQKQRIHEYLQWRDDELNRLDASRALYSDEVYSALRQSILDRCDALIKGELDSSQREQFDQLRAAGRLEETPRIPFMDSASKVTTWEWKSVGTTTNGVFSYGYDRNFQTQVDEALTYWGSPSEQQNTAGHEPDSQKP
jgi:hypothetical protein